MSLADELEFYFPTYCGLILNRNPMWTIKTVWNLVFSGVTFQLRFRRICSTHISYHVTRMLKLSFHTVAASKKRNRLHVCKNVEGNDHKNQINKYRSLSLRQHLSEKESTFASSLRLFPERNTVLWMCYYLEVDVTCGSSKEGENICGLRNPERKITSGLKHYNINFIFISLN